MDTRSGVWRGHAIDTYLSGEAVRPAEAGASSRRQFHSCMSQIPFGTDVWSLLAADGLGKDKRSGEGEDRIGDRSVGSRQIKARQVRSTRII